MQRNINISDAIDCMADPSCKYMCRVMMDVMVERFDNWSDESTGMRMPTGISPAARQQRQQAQKRLYLFHL